MELPHLGHHCAVPECNQLDYLPVTCELCKRTYCHTHHKYEDHSCPERYKLDVRIPVCPLCNEVVPSKSKQAPDLAVSEHIENNCQSKKVKAPSNKCSAIGCKVKELIPVKCSDCSKNYCLGHRHATDHDCKGPPMRPNSAKLKTENSSSGPFLNAFLHRSKNSAITQRRTNEQRRQSNLYQHNNLTEHEALQRAIALSQAEQNSANSLNNTDNYGADRNSECAIPSTLSEEEQLAYAIQLSLDGASSSNPENRRRKNKDCVLS